MNGSLAGRAELEGVVEGPGIASNDTDGAATADSAAGRTFITGITGITGTSEGALAGTFAWTAGDEGLAVAGTERASGVFGAGDAEDAEDAKGASMRGAALEGPTPPATWP
jgi:hypothetical protein